MAANATKSQLVGIATQCEELGVTTKARLVRDSIESDDEVIERMAAGDTEALGVLYDRYHRDVYGLLYRLLTPRHNELDDLVHDTFLTALRVAAKFASRSSVQTWLFGIASNLARNHMRGQRRSRLARELLAREATDRVSGSELAHRVESCQQLDKLTDAIAALPFTLRAAYSVLVLQQMTADQAAEILGIRKGTLWRRVHEARQRLRDAIGRDS